MGSKSQRYSESLAFTGFKKIRNFLRRFYPEDIIFECILRLNFREPQNIKELQQYPPWYLLILIKWTILFGEHLSPDRRRPTNQDYNKLVNLVHELDGKMRLPNQYSNFFLFFKNLSFQQFWLQNKPTIAQIARQRILFGYLEENHTFKTQFLSKTGISVNEFIEISIMLMVKFTTTTNKKEPFLTNDWFRNVHHVYSPEITKNFLTLISKDIQSFKIYFTELQEKTRNISYEFYEQTPFRSYPFLKYNEKYFCLSPNVLFYTIQNYLYDFLRSEDPHQFMDKFGGIFEGYIKKILNYGKLKFIEEEDIRKLLGKRGKLIDFLVLDNATRILIDAKGVEMGSLGRVSHLAEVIQNQIKTSIIKGIQQGFETVELLEKHKEAGNLEFDQRENYLLIVTYKDLYLGNGKDFYEYVAKEKLDKLIKDNKGTIWIPFEHMYFISIDDLELFIEYLNTTRQSISNSLKDMVVADSKIETKRLLLRQHVLEKDVDLQIPMFLKNEFNKLFTKIRSSVAV